MRTLLVVTLLTAGALATNCGGGGDHSDEAVAEFMSRCGDILDAERCGCILGHLESVTSEELQQLVAALGTQQTQGELSEDLSKRVAKASKPCFKDPFEEGFG